MWDPNTYLKFADERSRPFHDLVTRVGAISPRAVVDLGCGPGDQTATLASRWPSARVSGLDSSAEMIDRARQTSGPVEFAVGDVREWKPASDTDVVISNATLQWVPGHQELVASWIGALPADAWLAFQVPGNFDAPSHRLLRELAETPEWAARIAPANLRGAESVDSAEDYARQLLVLGCDVDAWETTYLHVLSAESGTLHPVVQWMSGTALRPVRAVLSDEDYQEFARQLDGRLAEAYPIVDGRVILPFRRIFVVAHK